MNAIAALPADSLEGVEALRDAIAGTNDALIAYAAEHFGKERMASTIAGIALQDVPIRFHVGNTRLYAIQGEYLRQLTQDHTTKQYLLDRGMVEAASSASTSEINSCMGGGDARLMRSLQVTQMQNAHRGYLLTTDGIHDHVDIEDLEGFVHSGDFSEAAFATLCMLAAQRGSSDDKAIVAIMQT
jgi:protein phosphatase